MVYKWQQPDLPRKISVLRRNTRKCLVGKTIIDNCQSPLFEVSQARYAATHLAFSFHCVVEANRSSRANHKHASDQHSRASTSKMHVGSPSTITFRSTWRRPENIASSPTCPAAHGQPFVLWRCDGILVRESLYHRTSSGT